MDSFALGTVWLFSALFGAWTALGVSQAVTGRLMFRIFTRRVSWSTGEVKLSGWSWAICGFVGTVSALIGGLSLGAHVIPVYWVGSPWGIFANPWPLVFLFTLLFQVLIEQHHKRRWPFTEL